MSQRNGQAKDQAPSKVHRRKAFGMSLLLSVRSGTGVVVGVDVATCGTGLRLGIPGVSLVTGVSMSSRAAILTEASVGLFGGALKMLQLFMVVVE
jgi:hypothetical protein